MRIRVLLSVVFMLNVLHAADWSVRRREPDQALTSGAVLHRFTVSGEGEAEFRIVQFDASKCSLRVIDQPSRRRAVNLAAAMQNAHAVAGTNGGFFATDFSPLGLTINDGQRNGTWMRSSLLGGVVMVKRGRLLLLWRDEFQDDAGITQMLQTGPRLVNNGQPVAGLEARSHRPRTFIATDSEGHWLLGIAESTTLAGLAHILSTPGIVTGFEISRALNFDGGKSTGLWAQCADGRVIHESEISIVRNFVAIVPRK
jgi:hypothetical protein